MIALRGRAAAPGAALAPAFVLDAGPVDVDALPEAHPGDAEAEVQRLRDALAAAGAQLEQLAEQVSSTAGGAEAEIFEAHAAFVADPELSGRAEAAVAEGASAERAVTSAFDGFKQLLLDSSSEYLVARAEDLDDVRDRVVGILLGRPAGADAPVVRSVVVARELTPSRTASLPRAMIAALVTETGSPTSHAAILARSLGIPAVVSCGDVLAAVAEGGDGVEVSVDGRSGEVLVDPDPDARDAASRRVDEERVHRQGLERLHDQPGATADGHRVELAANVGGPHDLDEAVAAGAEGSGLVRTEFLFQDLPEAPSVDAQLTHYLTILRAFPGHRVVFRTMDVGADKPLPFVERDAEENPALGLRGIRLHLARPELFRDQLRALVRAAITVDGEEDAGRPAIMFPLVAVLDELLQARAILGEVAEEEGMDLGRLEVGVMVEVPSAALGAARLAPHVDFLSIGTNDLLQYLFAADRLNGAVGELAEVCQPDVLRLLAGVVESAHAADAWVGVCGEAASDPLVAVALVGLGVDELSMTRAAIPEVKATLARLTLERCRAAVAEALEAGDDAASVRASLERSVAPTLSPTG